LATFDEHINQAKKNLRFLASINSNCNEFWDWQVTTCFYIAVHLANAHIAKTSNLHYRTHVDVKNALNPEVQISLSKLPEENYLAYVKLMNLSRRARYLCHENPSNSEMNSGFFTYDVHLTKAIKNLDKLLIFMESKHNLSFDKSSIRCISLTESTTFFFPKK
jgi:hypothetical protein